jgi:hypothetical protein
MNHKARIVYVPGFGGNNERSTTYQAILKEFGDKHEVACLKYDNLDPEKAKLQLEEQLYKNFQENNEIVLVGTSLGGYWANYLCERFDFPTILVNPSYDPSINLKRRGVPDDVLKRFTPIEFTPGLNKEVFIGGLDDVVNPIVLKETVGDTYPIHFYPNEGHRFNDKAPIIHSINEKINYGADYITVE